MSDEATATLSATHQEEDDEVLRDLWGDCFIGRMVSEDIYVTINESNGRNRAQTKVATNKVTVIPRDFIPPKKDITEEELMMRFSVMGMQILDKRQEDSNESLPPTPPESTQATFCRRLLNLRLCIAKLARPRILFFFKKRFQEIYPNYTFDNGHQVQTPRDMAEAYRLGPNTPSMRRMVYDCLIGMWGQDNGWALPIETIIMAKLGLEYSKLNCNGQRPGKLHEGGSIKQNLVATKQVILTPIRRIASRVYKEMIYKKERDLPKGMVSIIEATREEHGFDGKLGLYPGHPLLSKEAQEEEQLMIWFRTQRAKGIKTKEALCAAMMEEDPIQEHTHRGFVTPVHPAKQVAAGNSDCSDASTITTPFPHLGDDVGIPVPATITTPQAKITPRVTPPTRPVKSVPKATGEKQDVSSISNKFSPISEEEVEEDDEDEEIDEEEEARKKALAACKPCQHDGEGILSFTEYESRYYTPTWVAKKKNFPTHCNSCARKIVSGTKKDLEKQGLFDIDPDRFYHVKGEFSIFLCCNAAKEFHDCTYAQCKPCRQAECKKRKPIDDLHETRRGRRSRKEVSLCMPGERVDPKTGNMIASI